jgi:sulfite reductase beta subunit-like hemoprotein
MTWSANLADEIAELFADHHEPRVDAAIARMRGWAKAWQKNSDDRVRWIRQHHPKWQPKPASPRLDLADRRARTRAFLLMHRLQKGS